MQANAGRCLCGAVRYKIDSTAVKWTGYCHCESCRRACSAPVVAWFGVRETGWRWAGKPPKMRKSSDWAERYFCPECGSQMAYRSSKLPDEIHGLAATLDQAEDFAPDQHFFHSKRLQWLHVDDALPRYLDGGKTLDDGS